MVLPLLTEGIVHVKIYDLQGKVLHLSQEKLSNNNIVGINVPENIANQVLIIESKLSDGSLFRSQLVLNR